jgi:hypothetical protein
MLEADFVNVPEFEQGSYVEVNQILGDLLDRGQEFGVVTPLIQAAGTNLESL